MSNRLYYFDSELKEFDAIVTSVEERDGRYFVTLSETAFYPTSGGQPNDMGTIGNLSVLDVTTEGVEALVVHVVDGPLEVGSQVRCVIDWERRFDHMQQHLAQHILSAVIEQEFDVDTIGFHMGQELVSIDLATKELPAGALSVIEAKVNDVIFQNLSVIPHFVNPEELAKLELRNPPKVEQNIRIVTIEGFDNNACGGTHPKTTAQVGILKIVRTENTPRGVRLHFLSGRRALFDYGQRVDVLAVASSQLSATVHDIPTAVGRLQDSLALAKKRENNLLGSLAMMHAKQLAGEVCEVRNVKVMESGVSEMDLAGLKSVSKHLRETLSLPETPYVICLHSILEGRVHLLVECKSTRKTANEMIQILLGGLGGRGGGNKEAAQGSAPLTEGVDVESYIHDKIMDFVG